MRPGITVRPDYDYLDLQAPDLCGHHLVLLLLAEEGRGGVRVRGHPVLRTARQNAAQRAGQHRGKGGGQPPG